MVPASVTDRERWIRLLRESATDVATQPQRIAELCVQVLDVDGAGITLMSDGGHRSIVCATDAVSERIEELQITLGEGPCIDAIGTGTPVLVADLHDSEGIAPWRWPAFMAAAADAGVRACFALPLQIGAIRVGSLDMYRSRPGALTDDDLSASLLGAEAAAVALLWFDASPDGPVVDATDTGAGYHAEVHQASGMIMVQLGVTIEQAFLLLRARAFSTGRPLHDVAVDVVERRLRFSSEDL